jgi:protein tyrosine phosphatase (PTP) superfamily phosphohydrolase (DUF442 family)
MPPRPRLTRRLVARAGGFAALAAVVAYFANVFAGPNVHAVVPGAIYRCAQPSAAGFARQIERRGIRTVLNLRGTAQAMHQPKSDWYRQEAETTFAEGVSQEDVTLSAYLLPPPAEIRRALEVLDRADRPILLHCKQGADRTGLVSAIAILTQPGGTLAAARRELWPIYGHFPLGRTTAMDDFLDRYEAWLAGRPHAPQLFRDWLAGHYTPGPAASRLEWLDLPAGPVEAGTPFALKLRATNESVEPWRFEPGDHAAIHLLARVSAADGSEVTRATAGLFRRTVSPGESIDLTLAFGPLPAGAYGVTAELIDARGCGVPIRSNSFVKLGDGCAQVTVTVR